MAALGEPSQVNPFGEATDPFDPPYGTNQIVSIGAGGSLVLAFHNPILNHPNNLFGYDFILFGNTGFIITNEFDLSTFAIRRVAKDVFSDHLPLIGVHKVERLL